MTHEPRILVLTSRQPIRWADMDMLGHVNNTAYFRYMEQARIEWIYANHRDAFRESGPVIANATCTFIIPLVYPGTVEVRMFLGDIGRSSVGSFYELWLEGRKYAEGAAKMVWIDVRSGRPIPLPAALAARLHESLGASAS